MEFDNTTYEKINAYISDHLNEKERKEFENRIQSDILLKKEVDLHRSLKFAINEKEWSLIESKENEDEINKIKEIKRSEEYRHLESNLKEVGDEYFQNNPTTVSDKKWKYYIGAIVAILCVFLLIKNSISNVSTDTLYAEYSDWKSLPSLTVQGNQEKVVAEGEQLFFEKKYSEVVALFSAVINKEVEAGKVANPYVLSYLGASYLELNNFESAIKVFDQLANSKTVDSSKAYWYKTLVYLKQGDSTKAKEELSKILQDNNNYNFNLAEELLDKLD